MWMFFFIVLRFIGYSSSFCDVLLMCIVSAASLQIMVDHGRKQQENERFLVAVGAPHRLNWGLELNVCVVQCINFPEFYLLYHWTEIGFFFPAVFGQKSPTHYWFVVTESCIVLVSYHQTCIVKYVVWNITHPSIHVFVVFDHFPQYGQ